MASKRDLVEAHAFNRRRLVTAFLSGAPSGQEVEPARPARAVVGGAFLAVLVLAGSAIFGYLRPGLPSDWNRNTLVVVKSTGARYVATNDEVLYPVANTASARLLIPADSFKVVDVADEKLITDARIGQNLGIVGAPDHLPTGPQLVHTHWTACLDPQGRTLTRIADTPGAAPVAGQAVVVTANGATYVLVGGYRFPVAEDDKNPVLHALRLNGTTEQEVPGAWLDLFTEGPHLRGVPVDGAGRPYPDAGAPRGAQVGTLLRVASPDGTRREYLLLADGLVHMTPVATALYGISPDRQNTLDVTQADVADLPTLSTFTYPDQWPDEIPTPYEDDVVCALLATTPDTLATVHLARPVDGAAVPEGNATAVVQTQRGAYVRATSGNVTNRGTTFLIDSTARRFALGAPLEEVAARLGYADTEPVLVPLAWVNTFLDGPELSIEAAQTLTGESTGAG